MSHISAIICNSTISGYVFVNGFSTGPCSKDTSLSIPWDGHTPLFISFTPHGGNYLTTSLAFTSLDSLPVCDNVILTVWTGVVEVKFTPKKCVLFPPPLLPHEIKHIHFSNNDVTYTSSLIDYCGTWVIIEDTESTLLCEYLGEVVDDCDIEIYFNKPTLIYINLDDKHWIIEKSEENFELNSLGRYKCDKSENKLAFTSCEKLAPQNIDIEVVEGEIKTNKYIKFHNKDNQLSLAIDFVSSIMTGETDYAYSLLSSKLKNSFTQNQVVDFIGEVHHIDHVKYVYSRRDTALAVISKQSKNVYIASSFAFDFDSLNKIDNITPL